MAKFYTYNSAELIRVVDGDSLIMRVDLGFRMTTTQSFRLSGINAPEIRGEEREMGEACKAYVEFLLTPGEVGIDPIWRLRTYKSDSFGRWLADVMLDDGSQGIHREPISLSEVLVTSGYAVPWDGKGDRPKFDPELLYPIPSSRID